MPKPGFKVLLICLAVLSVLPMAAIERNASLPVRVQLIANGGCEEPLLAGNIPLWTEVTGTNWTQRSSNPLPWEGGNYFFPGVAASAELHQDVELTDYAALIDAGGAAFRFTGYVRSYAQSPTDYSRIVVEFRDAGLASILATLDSGNHFNTTAWEQILWNADAPSGTRYARIRLISTRRSGSNNDGYYDGLTLSALVDSPQNVTIEKIGDDILLDWDPVTTDPAGTPLSVLHYKVYADDNLEITCAPSHLVGTVATPGLLLPGLAPSADRIFFRVVAVRG